ncbi:MAG: hypothetical protein LBK44_04160, partial [Spirochaetales bacterium]|jgi:hypothetical protein|nr:hypothetical protein [Spirochaetales bacterium]
MCIMALTTVLVLEGCKSAPAPAPAPAPYTGVVYRGEIDENIECLSGTAWFWSPDNYQARMGMFIELLPSGKIASWREVQNPPNKVVSQYSTWERHDEVFKMVLVTADGSEFHHEASISLPDDYYEMLAFLQKRQAELGGRKVTSKFGFPSYKRRGSNPIQGTITIIGETGHEPFTMSRQTEYEAK